MEGIIFMKKIILVLVCAVISMSAYGRVTVTKDFMNVGFSSINEYKNFVTKLKMPATPKDQDCNSEYCMALYNQCAKEAIEAAKSQNPDVVIEGNSVVSLSIASYCTLITGLYYSVCKKDLTESKMKVTLDNYNEAKELILQAAQK